MGLVQNRQVPLELRLPERFQYVFLPQEVATDDDVWVLVPGVLVRRRFEHRGHVDETELEPFVEFPHPLWSQVRRHDEQDPVARTPEDQLLRVEAGHDRLSSPRVVREQETETWLGEELVVYGLELMG